MNTIFVLIMIIGGVTSQSGVTTVQQEFTTLEKCQAAGKSLSDLSMKGTYNSRVSYYGCYAK
jgi:hypothetical protein